MDFVAAMYDEANAGTLKVRRHNASVGINNVFDKTRIPFLLSVDVVYLRNRQVKRTNSRGVNHDAYLTF
jgi:hypothetical protein